MGESRPVNFILQKEENAEQIIRICKGIVILKKYPEAPAISF
jgi:hypothetical protein